MKQIIWLKQNLNFTLLVAFSTVCLLFSCKPDVANMPTVGSGERTFAQAASVAGSHGSYWAGVVISLVLAGLVVYVGHRTYNQLSTTSSFKPDWMIRPLAWAIALVLLFGFIIHPIFQHQYY